MFVDIVFVYHEMADIVVMSSRRIYLLSKDTHRNSMLDDMIMMFVMVMVVVHFQYQMLMQT